MITLLTGVPGSGKTLYALNLVEKEKGERPVFYNGIPELTLPWTMFDEPDKWHELEKHAKSPIVVIDEAQRSFRPRGVGSKVPTHVELLETHRHLGIDLYIITQHANLIDSNVRRLIGRHYHCVRLFGAQKSKIYEWQSCTEFSRATMTTGVRHEFFFPKASYGWYKSAEVHTHKRRIPFKVVALFAVPVVMVAIGVAGYFALSKLAAPTPMLTATKATAKGAAPGGAIPQANGKGTHLTRAEYLGEHAPRIAGLAYTSPHYDEVTKPLRAPVPAACVASARSCKCFTQDATPLHMDEPMCRDIAANGVFLDFQPSPYAPQLAAVDPAKPPAEVAPKRQEGVITAPLQAESNARPVQVHGAAGTLPERSNGLFGRQVVKQGG